MEDTFTKWMAVILFFAFVVFVGVWSEKKMINTLVEFPEEEVAINQDSLDWEDFTRALIWVESKGDSKAVGSKDDTGFYR